MANGSRRIADGLRRIGQNRRRLTSRFPPILQNLQRQTMNERLRSLLLHNPRHEPNGLLLPPPRSPLDQPSLPSDRCDY